MNVLEKYLATCPTRKVSKGTIIICQDEVPLSGFALKDGIVKLCNVTAAGAEKCLSFITADGLFPVCWLFSRTPAALFYYQAHTDCELWLVNKAQFAGQRQEHPELDSLLLDHFIVTCVADTLQFNALTQTKASSKLAEMLRHLCLRYGKDVRTDHVRISIPLVI